IVTHRASARLLPTSGTAHAALISSTIGSRSRRQSAPCLPHAVPDRTYIRPGPFPPSADGKSRRCAGGPLLQTHDYTIGFATNRSGPLPCPPCTSPRSSFRRLASTRRPRPAPPRPPPPPAS